MRAGAAAVIRKATSIGFLEEPATPTAIGWAAGLTEALFDGAKAKRLGRAKVQRVLTTAAERLLEAQLVSGALHANKQDREAIQRRLATFNDILQGAAADLDSHVKGALTELVFPIVNRFQVQADIMLGQLQAVAVEVPRMKARLQRRDRLRAQARRRKR